MKLRLLYALAGMLLICFLLGFSRLRRAQQRIRGIRISLRPVASEHFVSRAAITKLLHRDGVRPGQALRALQLSAIEDQFNSLPYVADAQAFVSVNGIFHLLITQKTVLARIRGPEGDYYLSQAAGKLPLSSSYSPDVILVRGRFEDGDLRGLRDLLEALRQRPFLSKYIIGISLRQSQYILDTRRGAHRVDFGLARRIDKKLDALVTFYKKVLNVQGWNSCRRIDLKYRDQIVCSKS